MYKQIKNLVTFLAASFLWTWACYTPIAMSGNSPYAMPWMILLILGGMGPSLMGVVMVMLTCDKESRRDYWRRCFSFKRISPLWWAVILLLFPLIYGVGITIDVAMGGSLPGMDQLRHLIANPLAIPFAAFISFMSGPWSEEFGWRGYALDRVIKPFGVLPGTILLGLIWGVWHLPLFFMPATWHGQIGFHFTGFWAFILQNIGLALLMTWVYLNTNRSILSGMMMHFTSNFTSQLVAPSSERLEGIGVFLMLATGLFVCARMSRQHQKSFREVKPEPIPTYKRKRYAK